MAQISQNKLTPLLVLVAAVVVGVIIYKQGQSDAVPAGAPMEQVPEYEAIRPGSTGDLYVKGDLEDLAKVIAFWVNQMQVAPAEVAAACREAVQDGWTPAASAFRIVEALAGERAAEPMPVPFANRKGCQ